MKSRRVLSFALFTLFGLKTHCFGQRFYFEVGGGYGLSMASQNLISKIDNGVAQTTNALVRGSLGRGLIFSGNIGYKKNENIAAEIGMSFLIGNKFKGYYYKELDFNEETTISANMFRIVPAIRLTAGEGNTRLYAKVGLAVRAFGKITIEGTRYDLKTNTTTEIVWKYSNGSSLGLMAALGVTKKINDKFFVFAELSMLNQSWAPEKGKVTKYEINGIDQVENLNPYQKNIDFSNNYTSTNNYPGSAYSHRQQLKQYFPFSSIGINIGIHLKFGKN